MNNRPLTPTERDAVGRAVYQAGRKDGFEDGVRVATREMYAKFGAQTFSAQRQPQRGFMQAFLPEHFDDVFSTYFNEEHFPEGLPRYWPKLFGMTDDEFAAKSGHELFEVVRDPDDEKFSCRWLHPSKVEELPAKEETFAAGHATNPRLRRVQITDKNGVRTWRYIDPDKGKPNPDKNRIGTGGGKAERTAHPENQARRTADYHPTAEAAQYVHEAFADPVKLHNEQFSTLAEKLDTLRAHEVKALARQVKIDLKKNPKKQDAVNALMVYLRKQRDEASRQDVDIAGLDEQAPRGTASGPRGRDPDAVKDRWGKTGAERREATRQPIGTTEPSTTLGPGAVSGPAPANTPNPGSLPGPAGGSGDAVPPPVIQPPARTISPEEHGKRLEAKRAEIAESNSTLKKLGNLARKIPELNAVKKTYQYLSSTAKNLINYLTVGLGANPDRAQVASGLQGVRAKLTDPNDASKIDEAIKTTGPERTI
jgi:hypothetical protein